MKHTRTRIAAVFLATAVSALFAEHLRGELPPAVKNLKPVAHLASTNELRLAIGLRLRNQTELDRFLRELSDPASPHYRHYLTPEQFTERYGPSEADYQSVVAFARSHGLTISHVHPNRMLLDVRGPASNVEKAFNVKLGVFQHPKEARTFYAPDREPTIDLSVPILSIDGLDDFSRPQPLARVTPMSEKSGPLATTGSGRNRTFFGKDFRTAYAPSVTLTGAGQKIGLVEFDGYDVNDITNYLHQAGMSKVPLINVPLDGFDGRPSGNGGEVEASLDIEMAISMAPGTAGIVVYMGKEHTTHFVDLLNRMATDNLAKQLACCWFNRNIGVSQVANQIFQQMAAQGQTFFMASGDSGAWSGDIPFPIDNPYVTSVGGTALTTTTNGGPYISERVWNDASGKASGGGISTYYTIPDYQTNISMVQNQGSTTMRNIPDVAIVGQSVYVRANGLNYTAQGTSCGAPLWAGFAALINQKATLYGPPIGFINPALTQVGHLSSYGNCFHDVVEGSTGPFSAVPGYDLCTGWGSPTGQPLIDALAVPDLLLISPGIRLGFAGKVGGPFTPKSGKFALSLGGSAFINWSLASTSAWFTVSPTHGKLGGQARSTNVTVSVNSSANALTPGVYTATVMFSNLTTGVTQSRLLTLSVGATNVFDAFEPDIDPTQWAEFGGPVGISEIATNYGGSVSPSNSLWFGGTGPRYATTIPVDASAGGQIAFSARLANGANVPWAIADDAADEAVVLEYSPDGGTSWATMTNLQSGTFYDWTTVILPIPVAAKTGGTQFRWRQLSNYGTNTANWALDNVIVGTGKFAPHFLVNPLSQNVVQPATVTLRATALGTTPLKYQWHFNGANLKGATSSSLTLANIQLTNAGTYTLACLNGVGSAVSADAVVTVAPEPSPLVSLWRAEGNARDTQGINDGTLNNNASFAAGETGQAFSFDGNNQCVTIPYSKTLATSNFTISVWVKPATQTGNNLAQDLIFGQDGGMHLVVRTAVPALPVQIGFRTKGGYYDLTSSGRVLPGQFSHVVGTWDGTALRLYINGVLDAHGAPGLALVDSGGAFYIGGFYIPGSGRADEFFNGLIDEVAY